MLGFLKICFFTEITISTCNALQCASMNNQECKIRSEIIDINSIFFSIVTLLHIHLNNIKALSPGTNILGVSGKNIKKNF